MPSLEEIMTVTSREEIRQFCIDAIKGIQEEANRGLSKQADNYQLGEIKSRNSITKKKKKSSKKKSARSAP